MSVRTGALLIHGLGGTQFDLGSMHKVLQRAGVETHAVTLPGHGGRHSPRSRHLEREFFQPQQSNAAGNWRRLAIAPSAIPRRAAR